MTKDQAYWLGVVRTVMKQYPTEIWMPGLDVIAANAALRSGDPSIVIEQLLSPTIEAYLEGSLDV
jgi:hypothetical protein